MLPIHIYNQLILEEQERRAVLSEYNYARRIMRNDSDPFTLDDRLFKNLYRLNKDMVHYLCETLLPHLINANPLAINPNLKIFAALSFFATGSYQRVIGQSFQTSMSQQTMSIIIKEVTNLIVEQLGNIWITFPATANEILRNKARFMDRTNFPGVIGAIDCTHVAIIAPHEEEHNYVNRKGFHSKNIQLICDYDLKVLNVNAAYAGATHDSFIWNNSEVKAEMERRYNEGDTNTWLLGDSGYPQQPWLMTPIANAQPNTPEFSYTERHIRARNCIERCNGVLKGRFRCIMGERKLRYKPQIVSNIVVACVILHNICTEGRLDLDFDIMPPVQNLVDNIRNHINQNAGMLARRQLIDRYFL